MSLNVSQPNQQLYTTLLIVFVGFIGVSMAYPLFPPLFLTSSEGVMMGAFADDNRRLLLGVTLAVYPLGQFVGSPIIGTISDKYGRKHVLLGCLAGTILGYFLSGVALQYGLLWLLILSRLATGLAESSIALAQSIIADLKGVNKHRGFGGITMAASIGYVIGPVLGGFLSDNHLVSWFSMALPFYIAALLAGITLLLAYLKLPESNFLRTTSQSIWQSFNLLQHLNEMSQNRLLKFLLLSSLVFTLGVDMFYEFGPVYLTGQFQMNSAQIAVYNVILCVALAVGGAYLPQKLIKHYSPHHIVIMAMMLFVLFMWLITFVSSLTLLFILFGLMGFVIPMASTVMNVEISDTAGAGIQGKVLGMQWGLRMLGDALICFIGGALILYSVSWPLLLGALSGLAAASIYFLRVKNTYYNLTELTDV